MNRVLAVIPARIGSSRLPRKPLQPLLGKPLVAWVWERAREMPFVDRVVVATDSVEVARLCRREGAEVVLTSSRHPSGTDRVQEAVDQLDGSFGVVVNIQGDEPLVSSESVEAAVSMVRAGFDAGTCAAPIATDGDFHDPAVVKVVRGADGSALYFSRAPIPHTRDATAPGAGGEGLRLRHIGVYAYTVSALARWVSRSPSPLEMTEKLEQLRALEAGLRIGVAIVPEAVGGVDTPEELERMEHRLRAMGCGGANGAAGAGAGAGRAGAA